MYDPLSGRARWSMRSRPYDGTGLWVAVARTTPSGSIAATPGSACSAGSAATGSRTEKPLSACSYTWPTEPPRPRARSATAAGLPLPRVTTYAPTGAGAAAAAVPPGRAAAVTATAAAVSARDRGRAAMGAPCRGGGSPGERTNRADLAPPARSAKMVGVSTPAQHSPPVYAVAAGAVLHAHAADTLEPAVLLHTFLPPGASDGLHSPEARVDVHGDGPRTGTVTLRVLTEGLSLAWQLPIAPFVAALPGQPGDEGRMVLLAVVDGEPTERFWAEPVDCERLAGELQVPVTDLVEALRGRLTPWLAEDLEILLHDDAHEHALDQSAAQTLATAVLAQYRGDLAAEQATGRVLRALEHGPEEVQVELGGRLSAALATAVRTAGPRGRDAVAGSVGPFESEVLRLLQDLPTALDDPAATSDTDSAMLQVLAGPDREDAVRSAVRTVALLAREALGTDLPDEQVLSGLGMVDDAGLARLSRLWVDLAVAAAAAPAGDEAAVRALAARTAAEGVPGRNWLRDTATSLAAAGLQVAGRSSARIAGDLRTVQALLERGEPTAVEPALASCLALARFVRARGGVGPGSWLVLSAVSAATAVGGAGLDRDTTVDLYVELLEKDVEAVDLLDAFVCATSQLLVHVDPHGDESLRRLQVAELLTAVPDRVRWLLVACLREAPDHDTSAADLSAAVAGETGPGRRPARHQGRPARSARRGARLPRRARDGLRRRGADAARGAARDRAAERAARARPAAALAADELAAGGPDVDRGRRPLHVRRGVDGEHVGRAGDRERAGPGDPHARADRAAPAVDVLGPRHGRRRRGPVAERPAPRHGRRGDADPDAERRRRQRHGRGLTGREPGRDVHQRARGRGHLRAEPRERERREAGLHRRDHPPDVRDAGVVGAEAVGAALAAPVADDQAGSRSRSTSVVAVPHPVAQLVVGRAGRSRPCT